MTPRFSVDALVGRRVRLEPLLATHVDVLVEAAGEDRSTYGFIRVPLGRDAMSLYVEKLLGDFDSGLTVPFAQVDASTDRVVGVTRFLTLRSRSGHAFPYAVEIGGTWLAASAQGTGINAEAKFLLLTYAFDIWNVARVDLKTDDRNTRAKASIARIGATFEGVLRQWQPSQVSGEESMYRDTAMFSIVQEDWAAIAAKWITPSP